jgi:bifunctional enzyme CysN/CysC
MPREMLRLITAGSVDDGKSTLIGRLLYDSGGVYEDQLEAVGRTSANGLLDLAFLTDGLRAEREQGITIDVAYRYFSTARRKFIIGDAPGHEQYTRNMATGASTSQVALLLMDARKGVLSQTIRHTFIASLLGIKHIVVAVNKMDLVGFQKDTFDAICSQFRPMQARLDGIRFYFVPVVAADGDNIVRRSDRMKWFEGPSALEYLESVPVGEQTAGERPFRMAVQYVLRGGDFRGYAGQIASGSITPGDEVLVLPSRKRVRVTRLPSFHKDFTEAFAPMSVSLCLSEQVDVGRGDMLADANYPPETVRSFQAKVAWMSEVPLFSGRRFLLKHTSQSVCSEIASVVSKLDLTDLHEQATEELQLNDIGTVIVQTHRPIFCDGYGSNRNTGSFILIDPVTNLTVGAGMIETVFDEQVRSVPNDLLKGAAVWFTGLSSSGKTTLSRAVYERLWARGYRVELLDGDEVRLRLSCGLGFSKNDRNENVRRIGFVAEVLARQGVIALASAISPYREARDEVRSRISNFLEIYVNAPLNVCEERDVKGLYRKARSGDLSHFTGIDDPYEPPLRPEIECRTDLESVADCAERIVAAIEARVTRHATREAFSCRG